jgi:MYXO-CTERM domain-containing protein
MKKSLVLATSLVVLSAASAANAAIVNYKATLNGTQAGTVSTATGSATLQFDDVTNQMSGTITWTGLQGTYSVGHFHAGVCGAGGGAGAAFPAPSGNTITLTNHQLTGGEATALAIGGIYINIHTSPTFGGGEIRGQVYPQASTTTCPPTAADAGSDASSSSSSGGSSSGGSSSGVSTTPTDGGGKTSSTSSGDPGSSGSSDDGGCNSSGTDAGSGLAVLGLGFAFALAARFRRRR